MSDFVPYEEHEAALTDLAGAEREVRRLRRVVTNLEKERAVSEDDPQAEPVRLLLELWWSEVKGSNPRVAYELESDRAPKVKAALKRRAKIARKKKAEDPERAAFDLCRKAILGVKLDKWAMGQNPKTGGKAFNDIAEHILNTDGDIEKFAKLYDDHHELSEERVVAAVERGMTRAAERQAEWDRGRVEALERMKTFGDGLCPWDRMLEALQTAGSRVEFYDGQPDSFKAQCPAHEDRNPSLGVKRTPEGTLLLFCWAGCETADVLSSLGLAFTDLFEGAEVDRGREDLWSARPRSVVPLHLRRAMKDLLGQDEERRAA